MLIFKQDSKNSRYLPKDESLINFACNDYLGLQTRYDLKESFFKNQNNLKLSSSSSRLLNIDSKIYTDFEEKLEFVYKKPALLFNNAYMANLGCISSLSSLKDVVFLCDKSVHASIIDALLLSKASFSRFAHNDMAKIKASLEKYKDKNIVLITEGLFSMQGDFAPIKELIKLKKSYENLYLYLDEAHSFGVCGESGYGLAKDYRGFDFVILGFGKALYSVGAAVICEQNHKELFINKARSLIYSTALPPLNVAWSAFVFDKLPSLSYERQKLEKLKTYIKSKLTKLKGELCILSLPCDEKDGKRLFKHLKARGFYLPIMRPPTVQKPCFRLCLNANMSTNLLARLVDEISVFNRK